MDLILGLIQVPTPFIYISNMLEQVQQLLRTTMLLLILLLFLYPCYFTSLTVKVKMELQVHIHHMHYMHAKDLQVLVIESQLLPS